MDMPVGTPIKEGMDTSRADFQKLFPTLREHRLSGYMALAIMTDNGVEEGELLFNHGEIIAAEYKYVAKEKTVHGEDALKLFMNACMGTGTFDVYELDDVISVREKNRINVLKYKPTDEDIRKLLPDTFIEQTLEEEVKRVKPVASVKTPSRLSREEVLKKYGISHPDERAVEQLLKEML